MGFMKETFSGNRANLLVAFGGDTPTPSYTPTDSVEEALEYFDLYVENGTIYTRSEASKIYNELDVSNLSEVETLRSTIANLTAAMDDDTAKENIILFKNWKAGENLVAGERLRYNGSLYKVLQNHTSQSDWAPDAAPSLFAALLIVDPAEIVEWQQPDSTNGYYKGDKVLHNGQTWISTMDNNVWEPGTVGAPWEVVETPTPEPEPEPEPTIPEWEQPDSTNPYNTGDRVTFEGQIYESLIDNNTWSPSAYPAGWQLISE